MGNSSTLQCFRAALHAAAIALAGASLPFSSHAAQCSAQSGPRTAVLVELYTSEGCDSCPPADRWLSSLQSQGYMTDRVVPLSLHVDYWDYIGWKDPYAKREFARRQRRLAELKRAKMIYTPQVVLQGQEFRLWDARQGDSRKFMTAVETINHQPPRAKLMLAVSSLGSKSVDVSLWAELLPGVERKNTAVYLAAYENKLSSQVSSGENRGKTLPHDYVVREWIGPIEFGSSPKVEDKRTLPLLPNANPKQSGVAAFVQNRSSGDVLQALMLPACSG
jgi:hypothetical protein